MFRRDSSGARISAGRIDTNLFPATPPFSIETIGCDALLHYPKQERWVSPLGNCWQNRSIARATNSELMLCAEELVKQSLFEPEMPKRLVFRLPCGTMPTVRAFCLPAIWQARIHRKC